MDNFPENYECEGQIDIWEWMEEKEQVMASRKEVFEITQGKCFYCGCKLDFDNFHCDHFVAKSIGGKKGNNLVPACVDCNLSKSDMTLEQFRDYLENLCYSSMKGRMLRKYLGIKRKKVEFYFEKIRLNER